MYNVIMMYTDNLKKMDKSNKINKQKNLRLETLYERLVQLVVTGARPTENDKLKKEEDKNPDVFLFSLV